jgi:hypothetical protein
MDVPAASGCKIPRRALPIAFIFLRSYRRRPPAHGIAAMSTCSPCCRTQRRASHRAWRASPSVLTATSTWRHSASMPRRTDRQRRPLRHQAGWQASASGYDRQFKSHVLGLRFNPVNGFLLVLDFGAGKVLHVAPVSGASSVFATVTGNSGLNALTFDKPATPTSPIPFRASSGRSAPAAGHRPSGRGNRDVRENCIARSTTARRPCASRDP